MITRAALYGAGALALVSVLSPTLFAQEMPRGNVANGKHLFETIGCYECHDYAGEGGAAGPRLINPPPYPAFLRQLRTPRAVMPPYTAKVLSDQQAADIYSYIVTLPKPPDLKTIPLLQN